MVQWFRALLERAKALLLSAAALDLEAQILQHCAERKAELLRRANTLEADNLSALAEELRRRVGALDLEQPLTVMTVALETPAASDVAPPALPPAANVVSAETSAPSKAPRRPTAKGS